MPDILLSTLNARYNHSSLGLRYLLANLGKFQANASILEFTIAMRPIDIVEQILAQQAKIVGLGVYIWNSVETTEVVALLKALAPEIYIVLGGPEVSYEAEEQAIVHLADYVICGSGEINFRELCGQLLEGNPPPEKIIRAISPPLDQLQLPYALYTDEDLQNRFVYVEASRGCPFKCEFCLSALDKTAWPFELENFLTAMDQLWQRGLRHFKFVDRTFNLKITTTLAILDFFLARLDEKTFLHFELIPDHLPEALKTKIQQFPAGSLQFEIGIQTFNPEIQKIISRKQDNAKSEENLRWLREQSHAHLHTDLIFGLPEETLDSFAQGFNRLIALNPHEIQVGILKRLRGAPIIRHTQDSQMVYNPRPPYNILKNSVIDFTTVQQMNRFARYWDMIGNSGRFEQTRPLLLGDNPFARFWLLSEQLYQRSQQTHQIALPRLFKLVHEIALEHLQIPRDRLEKALLADYAKTGQKGAIPFLEGQVLYQEQKGVKDARHQRQRRNLPA
ncbi:B12-binding domain-containing radical SAM protein [Thiolinea disciformis]|uniref:B12-binding domain-containing radical SAM protein n=1 Tax=Thiolinea disciformis TaxID=125614 RepID=UPI00036A10A5|nr:B12-binding domain-containing radical SAM protein [Thiolinea disciformis]